MPGPFFFDLMEAVIYALASKPDAPGFFPNQEFFSRTESPLARKGHGLDPGA